MLFFVIFRLLILQFKSLSIEMGYLIIISELLTCNPAKDIKNMTWLNNLLKIEKYLSPSTTRG